MYAHPRYLWQHLHGSPARDTDTEHRRVLCDTTERESAVDQGPRGGGLCQPRRGEGGSGDLLVPRVGWPPVVAWLADPLDDPVVDEHTHTHSPSLTHSDRGCEPSLSSSCRPAAWRRPSNTSRLARRLVSGSDPCPTTADSSPSPPIPHPMPTLPVTVNRRMTNAVSPSSLCFGKRGWLAFQFPAGRLGHVR